MTTRKTMMIVTTGATSLAIAGVVGLTAVSAASGAHTAPNAQEREQKYDQRLQEAVTDGKLTSAQEASILSEHKQLESEMKAATTKAARKTARQTVRSQAEAWAKANGVSGRWLLTPRHLRG
jgi:CRISPR/Cas system-associated endoribonuclease Cas2